MFFKEKGEKIMTTQMAFVLVAFLICFTFILSLLIDKKQRHDIKVAEEKKEFWKGRYYGLGNAFEHAANCTLSDDALEALSLKFEPKKETKKETQKKETTKKTTKTKKNDKN